MKASGAYIQAEGYCPSLIKQATREAIPRFPLKFQQAPQAWFL